jgi:hypothetical protein
VWPRNLVKGGGHSLRWAAEPKKERRGYIFLMKPVYLYINQIK